MARIRAAEQQNSRTAERQNTRAVELQNITVDLLLCCSAALLFFYPVALSGCAGYQVGAGSLYAPDVRTVFVPMIESDSYRRDLGERLTEAVVKEIELKTPYKVVNTPDADSILSARLIRDTRRTLVENAFDDPRVSEIELHAEVRWLNRRRQPIVPMQALPIPPDLVLINQTSNLIPEVGQSVASQQQQAIERLAQQIVSTMEAPW
jgi:hypothetical protein